MPIFHQKQNIELSSYHTIIYSFRFRETTKHHIKIFLSESPQDWCYRNHLQQPISVVIKDPDGNIKNIGKTSQSFSDLQLEPNDIIVLKYP